MRQLLCRAGGKGHRPHRHRQRMEASGRGKQRSPSEAWPVAG
jgi:hypothetical protein